MHHRDTSAMARGNRPEQRHGPRTVMLYLCVLSVIVGAFIVSGCPGDDDEQPLVRRGNLVGAQEVPPATTAATGTITLTISVDRTRIDYQLVLVPPFTSNVTMAHIHVAPAGVNGPVVLFFCTNLAPPAGVPRPQACPTAGGTISGTLTAADLVQQTAASSFAEVVGHVVSGTAYANAHTVTNPGGEIRAQLTP